jgi:hypothetical protein
MQQPRGFTLSLNLVQHHFRALPKKPQRPKTFLKKSGKFHAEMKHGTPPGMLIFAKKMRKEKIGTPPTRSKQEPSHVYTFIMPTIHHSSTPQIEANLSSTV